MMPPPLLDFDHTARLVPTEYRVAGAVDRFFVVRFVEHDSPLHTVVKQFCLSLHLAPT
jgi:hypothetical protein